MEKREHTEWNDKSYDCKHCEKQFNYDWSLTRHLTKIHGYESVKKDFVCDKCSKIFTSKKTLVQHNKQTHENIRLHECDSCEKKFKRKPHLDDHKALKHEPWNLNVKLVQKNLL